MKNQKGFGTVELLVTVLVICLLGIAGYFVYKGQKDTKNYTGTPSNTTTTTSNSNKDPVLSSESKIAKPGYKDCGSADYSNVTEFSYSSDDEPQTLSDCFERAFADCEKATYSVLNVPVGPKGVTTQYSIEGTNSKSNKCRGGFTYVEHSLKEHVGKYGFCDLDQTLKPFVKAYTAAASGTGDEVAKRCEGTISALTNL